MKFTKLQTEILLQLSKDQGLTNMQLADGMKKAKSNLSAPLDKLEGNGVIYYKEQRSRKSKKNKDPSKLIGYREYPYYIHHEQPDETTKVLKNFRDIIEAFIDLDKKDDLSEFLKSNYTNNLIKKNSFFPVYNTLKKRINDTDYNKIISQSILELQAFKNEIEKYPDAIRGWANALGAPAIAFNLPENNLIELLRTFNAIDAVQFYRSAINNTYSQLLRETHNEFLSDSLKEFIDLDIRLSPFSSYPVNNPIHLLFGRPFERLYNDVYLIDESDYEKFIRRAYIIYSNFGEIIAKSMSYMKWERDSHIDNVIGDFEKPDFSSNSEYLECRDYVSEEHFIDDISLEDNMGGTLDTVLKTSIFFWNLASSRIDTLCEMLNYLKNCKGSGKYRIFTDERGLNLIDLETNNPVYSSSELRELNGSYFLVDIMLENSKDPFMDFRPCKAFEDLGIKAEIMGYGDLYQALDRHYDHGIRYE